MIKKFLYVFIPVFAVLLMSHNVNAISPVINLNNYNLVRAVGSFNQTCTWIGGDNYVNQSGYCSARINGTTKLKSISSDRQYSFKSNDILIFYLFVWVDGTNTISIKYQPRLNSFGEISNGFDVLSYDLIDYNTYYSYQSGDDGYINWMPNNDFNIDFNNRSYFYRIYEISLRARSDGDLFFNLESNAGLFEFNNNDSGAVIKFSIRNAKHYRFDGDKANKEVEEKTQNASDNSATSGSSSSSNSQTATSSLLSVITSGIGAITSASPTNCKINGNMGNLNVGNIDLCANPVPTFMALIGSIIAVLVVLPLVIVLFNRFISIIRSFQR